MLKADKLEVNNTFTAVQASVNFKADKATTYTKIDVDTLVSPQANQLTTYTKPEVDDSLALKANNCDVYDS